MQLPPGPGLPSGAEVVHANVCTDAYAQHHLPFTGSTVTIVDNHLNDIVDLQDQKTR